MNTGEEETLEVNLKNRHIDVDIKDKDFIKRIIKLRGEIGAISARKPAESEQKPEKKKKAKGGGSLGMLRTIADALSTRGLSLTLSYEGNTLLTLGADAHPTFLQLITKTRGVAINRFFKLIH